MANRQQQCCALNFNWVHISSWTLTDPMVKCICIICHLFCFLHSIYQVKDLWHLNIPNQPLPSWRCTGWQSPPHPHSQSILPCSPSATFTTQCSLNKMLGGNINLPLHGHFWKCKMQLLWLTSGTHKTKWLLGNATLEEDIYGPKAWTMSVEKWEAGWFLSMPTILDSVCVIWSRKIPQACV